MCDNCSFKSKEDENTVMQTIERIINKIGKGFLARMKNGKLTVDPEVLVQCLRSTSATPAPGFLERNIDAPGATAETYSDQLANPPIMNVESVLLRTLLRYGRISYEPEDLQLWTPGFTVPDYINQSLLQTHGAYPVTGVTIMSDNNGKLRYSVDPKLIEVSRSRYEGIKIAENETLMVKTRIRNGLVSFQEDDIHFRRGHWQVPQYIMDSLEANYSSTVCGVLYIISNEKEELRCIVKPEKVKQMLNLGKIIREKVENFRNHDGQ